MTRLLPLVVLAVALTGCHLIDQKTFAPAPEAKPVAPSPPAPQARIDTRVPLVVIDFSNPHPEYRELLGVAVRAAEARDHAVQFDVLSVAKTIDEASAGQDHAVEVMHALLEDRVEASHIHLGLRADPSLTSNQVRVYVR